MTKMAAMPMYGKNPSKIFSGTGGPISTKLGMKHQWLKYYNVYINHDPVMTLDLCNGKVCESWFLIHQDVYHDLFVCS